MSHFKKGDVVPFRDKFNTTLRIEEEIGSGSQGDVYKALDILQRKRVAVKHCYGNYATNRDQFYKKLQLLARYPAPHPDLCWPMRVSPLTDNKSFLYTMPLLEGYRPLTGVITGRDGLTDGQKAVLLYKIVKIFRKLHDQDFVYGDVSDRNILYRMDKAGEIHVKLIDMDNLSMPGHSFGLQGTGKYRAPELLLPDPNRKDGRPGCPTVQSDMYAIQVLAFRVLMRRHPLDGALARTRRADDHDGFLEFYARRPRFIFDGTANDPGPGVRRKWEALHYPMQLYFSNAFSQRALHHPDKRIGLEELLKCLSLSYRI